MQNHTVKNYEIIIEGSSSAAGYSDESGRGGFSGRVAHHFWEYSQEGKRRNNWTGADRWVYVQNYARPGRLLPSWTNLMDNHIHEVSRSHPGQRVVKMLGIFVLEAHPLGIGRKYGESLPHVWRESLEQIEFACGNSNLEPLFVQMPVPIRSIGEKGHTIHEAMTRLTRKTAYSLDTEIVDVASMPGIDIAEHVAEDGMHPNAAGHKLIFENLLPIIYKKLDLEPLY